MKMFNKKQSMIIKKLEIYHQKQCHLTECKNSLVKMHFKHDLFFQTLLKTKKR